MFGVTTTKHNNYNICSNLIVLGSYDHRELHNVIHKCYNNIAEVEQYMSIGCAVGILQLNEHAIIALMKTCISFLIQ